VDIGLNSRQIEIVANAIPKRDYYIIAPAGRRLVQLALGPRALAFMGASDKESIARIRQLVDECGPENWPDAWLEERQV